MRKFKIDDRVHMYWGEKRVASGKIFQITTAKSRMKLEQGWLQAEIVSYAHVIIDSGDLRIYPLSQLKLSRRTEIKDALRFFWMILKG